MRDRADARLLALNDFVWRRSFHAGQKSRDGAVASFAYAIPRRFALADSVSRFRRRNSSVAIGAGEGRSLLHQHPRRPSPGPAYSATPAEGHEADCDDYRWKAISADLGRRAHL